MYGYVLGKGEVGSSILPCGTSFFNTLADFFPKKRVKSCQILRDAGHACGKWLTQRVRNCSEERNLN